MNAREWAQSETPTTPPAEYHCPTSDVWQGRFTKIAPSLLQVGFDENQVALFVGMVGEIGDNCFAHNAPAWIDTPGCWFEYTVKENTIWCVIADRGRGILNSLKNARPTLATDSEALMVALTERVSGRTPEKRGNGLKYATDVLSRLPKGSFSLQSGIVKWR